MESIINMAEANIQSSIVAAQKGVVRCDGRLTKTRHYLQFEPFNRSATIGPYLLPLIDIVNVDTCWGKGAGILPITPDGIEITLKDGSQYQFIVGEPQLWIARLLG